jgi:hypothetical protein
LVICSPFKGVTQLALFFWKLLRPSSIRGVLAFLQNLTLRCSKSRFNPSVAEVPPKAARKRSDVFRRATIDALCGDCQHKIDALEFAPPTAFTVNVKNQETRMVAAVS